MSQIRQEGGPDPKSAPRHRDSTAGIAKCRREGACRACGMRPYTLHRHHIVPRSAGGDDYDHNIVPLCEGCHASWHGSGNPAIRSALRHRLTDDERLYVVAKMGQGWMDSVYPP